VTDRLRIDEIAALWSQETGQPASVYVRQLSVYVRQLIEYAKRLVAKGVAGSYPEDFDFVTETAVHTRSELKAYCDENDIDPPRFWFGGKASMAGAKACCRNWLEEKVHEGKAATKAEYRKQAVDKIDRLSERGFDEVWAEVVPKHWKKGGHPRNPRKS
jgi:hypothetical protein